MNEAPMMRDPKSRWVDRIRADVTPQQIEEAGVTPWPWVPDGAAPSLFDVIGMESEQK